MTPDLTLTTPGWVMMKRLHFLRKLHYVDTGSRPEDPNDTWKSGLFGIHSQSIKQRVVTRSPAGLSGRLYQLDTDRLKHQVQQLNNSKVTKCNEFVPYRNKYRVHGPKSRTRRCLELELMDVENEVVSLVFSPSKFIRKPTRSYECLRGIRSSLRVLTNFNSSSYRIKIMPSGNLGCKTQWPPTKNPLDFYIFRNPVKSSTQYCVFYPFPPCFYPLLPDFYQKSTGFLLQQKPSKTLDHWV